MFGSLGLILKMIFLFTGVDMLLYPAQADLTTGPTHFKQVQQGRANNQQVFVITIAPATSHDAEYVSYGHPMIIDPWGQVVVAAQGDEEILVADLDVELVKTYSIPNSDRKATTPRSLRNRLEIQKPNANIEMK